MLFRRVKLEVESLEKREVLSATLPVAMVPVMTTASVAPTVPPTDTSTLPANPANSVVTAQVTALGPLVGSNVSSITVSGLPQNLPASSVMSVSVGGNNNVVSQATSQGNGQTTLTVTGGINPITVQVGSTVTVTIGTGGNVAPSASLPPAPATPPAPPPAVAPIDPTLLPAS